MLADAGYNRDANLTATGPDRLIALGKGRDQASVVVAEDQAVNPPLANATPRQAMAYRLSTTDGHAPYKRRAATVEPAIGNFKKILDRGLQQAASELHLAAAAYSLMRIHRTLPA